MLHVKTEIDDAFIKRVYKTSAYVWGFVALVLLSFGQWWAIAGWSWGSILSAGTLWSLQYIIRRAFVPENIKAKTQLGKFSILKIAAVIPILLVAVWACKHSTAFIFAFFAGVLLTQTVIVLKVLGIAICQYSND